MDLHPKFGWTYYYIYIYIVGSLPWSMICGDSPEIANRLRGEPEKSRTIDWHRSRSGCNHVDAGAVICLWDYNPHEHYIYI